VATALYPLIEKLVEDEWVKLERDQITPWAFMTAGPPFRVKDFYWREISYQGIEFEGSPCEVFWGRYIEPFLEDIVQRREFKGTGYFSKPASRLGSKLGS